MQLRRCALVLAFLAVVPSPLRADDRVEMTTTWLQENRRGELGGLRVVHPAVDLGVDLGETMSLGVGYAADVVSGATQAVYSSTAAADAVSSATLFEDTRHQGSATVGARGRRSSLSVTGGAGFERDYTSITASASGDVDLPGKNTNLNLSYTHNFDQVCDRDNIMVTPRERQALTGADPCERKYVRGRDTAGTTTWRDLSVDTTQATLSQNLSPTMALQLSVFGQVLQGFQSNPYRRVRVTGVESQEHVPAVRGRLAVSARLNKYFVSLRSAVHASLRGYSDTWGVNSATGELAYSQYAGKSVLLRVHSRVYQQTAARFFKDAYYYEIEDTAGEFFTGDRELAPLRHLILGGKLSYVRVSADGSDVWGLFDEVKLNLRGDVLLLEELAADSVADNPVGICNQFLSSCQTVDGFMLQVALLLAY